MTEEQEKTIGERLIHFIVESGLFTIEFSEESVPLVIWSANAVEQIDAFLAENKP